MTAASGDEARARLAAMRARKPPENEIPVSIPLDRLLARTDDLAVALTNVHAYRSGLGFTVETWAHSRAARREIRIGGQLGQGESDIMLLLGFEYADGRTVTNVGSGRDLPSLFMSRVGEPDSGSSASYYLQPLPSGATLTLHVAWPAMGIAETRHELEAAAIREAASRATVLWPDQPNPSWPQAPAPELPAGTWFDRVLRDSRK